MLISGVDDPLLELTHKIHDPIGIISRTAGSSHRGRAALADGADQPLSSLVDSSLDDLVQVA